MLHVTHSLALLDIPFLEPHLRAQLPPSVHLLLPPSVGHFYEGRPVRLMIVLKLDVSTELLPHAIGGEQPVLHNFGVEAHLVLGHGVDKGCDQFVERVEKERHVDDECASETLGVVRLEDVQNLDTVSMSEPFFIQS